MSPDLRTPLRLLAVTALTALFAVPFVPALAGDNNGNSNDKQTICHANDSNENAN